MGNEKVWAAPDDETLYLCDDCKVRTWGEMVSGLDADVVPACDEERDMLLMCFGACEVPV